MKIMNDISYLRVRTDEANVLTLDDPELSRTLAVIEVGWWTPTDRSRRTARIFRKAASSSSTTSRCSAGAATTAADGSLRSEHEARPAWGAVLRHGSLASGLSLFFEIDNRILDNFPQA
jgi:hypothetical protein